MVKNSTLPAAGSPKPADRRSESRTEFVGSVVLRVDEPFEQVFTGELLDVSNSGFRAVHGRQDLSPSQLVHFRHAWGAGKARMMWKSMHAECPDKIATGFLVVEHAERETPVKGE